MPAFTLDIEDYSPFITYSGSDWSPGTSVDDQEVLMYSRSTFMKTNKGGATASISFNGTGLVIYGAKRANHGLYVVNVDGQNQPSVNGSATPDQFGVVLFGQHDFSQGPHTVQITNQNDGQYLDIDWVTIEANIGEDSNGKLYVVNYEDSDTSFTYLPSASQWSVNPLHLGMYSASSGHVTTTTGTSFDFSFNGDGVSLYGPMSQSGAPYSVSLDGGTGSFKSSSDRYLPQALLFHATNLGAGQHHLKVSYQPTANYQSFAVDYANVYTTNQASNSTSGSSNGSSSSSNGGSQQNSSGLSASTAVGITVAACVVAALLGVLIFLMRKKRKQQTVNLATPSAHHPSLPPAPAGIPAAAMADGYWSTALGSHSNLGSSRHRVAPSDSNVSSSNPAGRNAANTSSDGGFSDIYAASPPLAQKSRIANTAVRHDREPGISPPEYTPDPFGRL